MKSLILLSGGIDSTLMLAMAKSQGHECLALSFDYGQRHRIELEAAAVIADYYHTHHKIISIDPNAFSLTSLVNNIDVPKDRTYQEICNGIPNTYVPARNTLFLAYATGQAELLNADEIYFGANADDRSAYPDCRYEFVDAFNHLLSYATKQSVIGKKPTIITPLITWDKARIIQEGIKYHIPFEKTHSCYDPTPEGSACKRCDACQLRQRAFMLNGM